MLIISAISLAPLLLTKIGLSFGSVGETDAGTYFAGWMANGYVGRIDVNALGLVLLIGSLTVALNRMLHSPLAALLGITMVLAGLVDTIQIAPEVVEQAGYSSIHITSVWSALLSRLGSALILFVGTVAISLTNKPRQNHLCFALALVGTMIGAATWTMMGLGSPENFLSSSSIHFLTFTLYGLTGLALHRVLRRRSATVLGQLTLAALIPLVTGQIWLITSATTVLNQGFHIAVLLKWLAWMLPTIGLGLDLTNSIHALGKNQEKMFLRSVIDAIPHFIFARDHNGCFTLVNKSVADFYNLNVDQVEGRHLQEIHADLEQCRGWVAEDREILKHGRQMEIPEALTIDAEGRHIWITATKKLLPATKFGGAQVLGVSIDITRQRTAETALAERLKFEQASAAIVQAFVQTTSENLQDTMDRILQHLGFYTGADRSFIYQFTEKDKDARLVFSWLRSNKNTARELPVELNHRGIGWMSQLFALNMPVAADKLSDLPESAHSFRNIWNTPCDASFLAIPIMQNFRVMGFLGIDACDKGGWKQEETNLVRYVTDMFMTVWSKLEAEKSLVGAMKEAQASSQAKSEFLANMSHEIRTPMNCVIGISDLLMEMDPTDNQRQYLDMISQSGSALLALINDILDLSKIEAGQLALDPLEMNLRGLIEEVSGLVAFNTQPKGVEMVSRIAPGAPDKVVCDPNRLRQVLTNLLNNAAKFTAAGHIYLNVEPTGENGDEIDLKFEITDTGIGIEKEKLEAIFEKFTQADASTTRRFGGTGLGLPISQHLVNLMGGKISADSTPGTGTTFAFTLPLKSVRKDADLFNPPAEHDQRVLVVTSHKLSGEVLAEQVRLLGFDCSVALGCDDALKILHGSPQSSQKPCPFILVDQNVLPDDVSCIKEFLGEKSSEASVRLIMLTALSSAIREKELLLQGFSGTLPKPVRPHQLKAVLEGHTTISPVQDNDQPTAKLDGLTNDEVAETQDNLSNAPANGPLILIAEDNPFNQRVAEGMFKLLGCRVEVASNGAEAVAMVQKTRYDMIFMDCQMPEMDGYDATRVIRGLEDRKCATIPIVAMTANALSGDKRACFEAGMDDFLSKPINKATLSEMLSKWEQLKIPV